MSLSSVSSYQPSGLPGSLVPTLPSENAVTAAEASKAANTAEGKHLTMFAEGDDEPSFWDLLDVINPLQHIPVVNNLYREVTGDKIGVAARLAGGALFGLGPLGLVAAAANCILEEATGEDAGGHMLALLRDDQPAGSGTGTALAAAQTPAATTVSQTTAAEIAETPKAAEVVAAATAKPAEPAVSPSAKSGDETKAQPLVMDLMGGEASSVSTAAPARPVPVAAATPAAATPAAATPAAEAVSAQQQVAAAANRPMSLGREPRFMPLPGRTTALATQSPPAVNTTISNTGYRSNAPVAGHRPGTQRTASAAMAQQMVAAQAESSAASQGQGGSAQSGDWFTASMMQAMDKYEKGSRLGRQQPAGAVTEQ